MVLTVDSFGTAKNRTFFGCYAEEKINPRCLCVTGVIKGENGFMRRVVTNQLHIYVNRQVTDKPAYQSNFKVFRLNIEKSVSKWRDKRLCAVWCQKQLHIYANRKVTDQPAYHSIFKFLRLNSERSVSVCS